MIITLSITHEEILHARKRDGFGCLIANQLNKLLHPTHKCYVSNNDLIIFNEMGTRYTPHGDYLFFQTTKDHCIIPLPNVLKSKIIRWDKNKTIQPFEISINIPDVFIA